MKIKLTSLLLVLLCARAASQEEDKIDKNGKWAIFTADSQVIRSEDFDGAYAFRENIAVVSRGKACGFIHRSGKMLTGFDYHFARSFCEGYGPVAIALNPESKSGDFKLKCGYIDTLGNVVVPLIYDDITWFSEGLAAVNKNDTYGYINGKNQVMIPFIFDYAGRFMEGLALVSLDGKYGFINTAGEFMIQPGYDYAEPFDDEMAKVTLDGEDGYINKKGERVSPFLKDRIYDDYNNPGKFMVEYGGWEDPLEGVLDASGKVIVPAIYKEVDNHTQSGYYITTSKDSLVGLYDTSGKEILKPLYTHIRPSRNFIIVRPKSKNKETQAKLGAFNTAGKQILPFEFEDMQAFGDTLYATKQEGYHEYLGFDEKYNSKGKYMGKNTMKFREAIPGDNDFYVVQNGEKFGVIDENWKEIIPVNCDIIYEHRYVFSIERDGKWGIVDGRGNMLLPVEYLLGVMGDSVVAIYKDEGVILTDLRGKQIIPGIYDSIRFAAGDVLIVYAHGMCGLVSTYGFALTPLYFSFLGDLKYDYGVAKKDGKYFFFDKNGRSLSPTNEVYDSISPSGYYCGVLYKEGKCALVSDECTRLTEFIFDHIDTDNEGDNYFRVKQNGKYGFINRKGEIVIPVKFDDATNFDYDDVARVWMEGIEFKIDKQGELVE